MANSKFNLFDELQTFINLVKHKTAANSSAQSNVSIATIWRKIDTLEKYLNTQLIYRRSQGSIELTDNGRHIFSNLFLNNIRLNNSLKHNINDKPVLYVLASVPIMMAFADSHLKQIEADTLPYRIKFITYSQMAFEIDKSSDSSNSIWRLAQGFDIVYLPHISSKPPSISNWKNLVTLKIQHNFYASKVYIAEHGQPQKLSELASHKYINDKTNDTLYAYSKEDKKSHAIKINSSLTSNSMIARAELIKNGLGITHLPATMNIPTIHQNQFVNILEDYYLDTFYISVFQNTNVVNQSKTAVKDFLSNAKAKYKNIIVNTGNFSGIENEY